MCQVNTFMFKESEIDGDKLVKIVNIFQSAGFDNFYEYNNPHLRNIRRDLRLFGCGNLCDCGSVITKKVVVDEIVERAESNKLTEIIKKILDVVGTVFLFSHWYKTNSEIAREKVVLERATKKVSQSVLDESVYRDMFYNEVLEVSR